MSGSRGWSDNQLVQWATNVWSPRTPKQVRPRQVGSSQNSNQTPVSTSTLCPKCNKKYWKIAKTRVTRTTGKHCGVVRSSLSYYLDIMYQMCMSPFKEINSSNSKHRILHQVIYAVVAFLAFTSSVRSAKHFVMVFLATESHISKLVGGAFHVLQVIAVTYFMYMMAFNGDGIKELLECLSVQGTSKTSCARENQRKKTIGKGIAVATMILVTTKLLFGIFDFGHWSLNELIATNSYLSRLAVRAWKPNTYSNLTEQLWEKYSSDTSASSIAYAIANTITNACGWMQQNMLQNFVLLTIHAQRGNVSRLTDTLDDDELEGTKKWNLYEEVKLKSNRINEQTKYFLPLFHVNNGLMLAHFLMDQLEKRRYGNAFLLWLTVGKLLYTYWVGADISNKNQKIRKWIKKYGFETGGETALEKKVNALFLLDDVDQNLIGMGEGEFFLNESFLLKFIGAVSTVFMILAESRNNND